MAGNFDAVSIENRIYGSVDFHRSRILKEGGYRHFLARVGRAWIEFNRAPVKKWSDICNCSRDDSIAENNVEGRIAIDICQSR